MLTLDELKLKLTDAFAANATAANSVSGSNLGTRPCAAVTLKLKSVLEMESDESRTNTMS